MKRENEQSTSSDSPVVKKKKNVNVDIGDVRPTTSSEGAKINNIRVFNKKSYFKDKEAEELFSKKFNTIYRKNERLNKLNIFNNSPLVMHMNDQLVGMPLMSCLENNMDAIPVFDESFIISFENINLCNHEFETKVEQNRAGDEIVSIINVCKHCGHTNTSE